MRRNTKFAGHLVRVFDRLNTNYDADDETLALIARIRYVLEYRYNVIV